MKKYHLTKKAFEDLSDIWTYTYDNWSEEQADKYYSILISTVEDIVADRLYACRPYPQIGKDIWGYSIKRHIIFYKKEEDGILVIRILHCSMDLKNHFNPSVFII